jgi:hypothetical protein
LPSDFSNGGNDTSTFQEQSSPGGTTGSGGPAVGADGGDGGAGSNTAAIAGIAVGATVGPLLVVVSILLYLKHSQRRSYALPFYSSKSSSSAAPSLLTWFTFKVRL